MKIQPNINRNALVLVVTGVKGFFPLGMGVVYTGEYTVDGIPWVDYPAATDGLINGVIYETPADNASAGFMIQAGLSNVQVTIGAKPVSTGDKLNLQDSTGVWQKANTGSFNVYYVALQNAQSGELCWVAPIASSSL